MSKGLTALQPAKVASGAGAKALCYHFGESLRHVVLSSRAQRFTIKKQEAAKVRTTQAVRLLQYRVEDRRELPGEELMTCRTSAVAVCCSSASLVSVMR